MGTKLVGGGGRRGNRPASFVTSHTGPANLPIINGVRREYVSLKSSLVTSHTNPAS